MKEKEKMPRLERQLRLYEVICRYAIAQFSNICEVFPYNKRRLQRDLLQRYQNSMRRRRPAKRLI